MHRFMAIVAVFAMFACAIAFAHGNPATAQDAMATHPVVGGWQFVNDLGGDNIFPFLGIFHADGTYIEDFPDESSYSIGVWEPTGERTATVTFHQVYVIDDKLVNGEGRFTAEVDETGSSMTTDGTFVGRFEDGAIEFAAEGPSTGTRMEILPVVPLETLVGTPTATEEATPAP